MQRYLAYAAALLLAVTMLVLAAFWPIAWWGVAVFGALALLGTWDLLQTRSTLRRNYPLLAHFRYGLESIGPEMRQYADNPKVAPLQVFDTIAGIALSQGLSFDVKVANLLRTVVDNGRLAVEVIAFESEDTASLTARIAATGAGVILIENDPPVARVWATREQLAALAALPNIYRVEPYDPPRLLNDGAAQVMTTWNLRQASRNGLLQDLMGAGQTVGLVDSGLDNKTTSPNIKDFFDYTGGTTTSRVIYNANSAACGDTCTCTSSDDSANGGHGTHVAGTMVGNG